MSRTTLFVDVILPLAVPNLYTYRVPYELNDQAIVGKRVIVQFGKGKLYTALIRFVHEQPPQNYVAKYLNSILDDTPVVNLFQLTFWDWMSNYYMCSIGEVMIAALPGALRLSSETQIIRNPLFDDSQLTHLTDKQFLLIDALKLRNVLNLQEVAQIIDQQTVYPVIKSLIEKKAVLIREEVKEKFKPKIESFIRLTSFGEEEENLKIIFPQLEKKATKQLEVLMALISLSKRYSKEKQEVKKSAILQLLPGAESAVTGLVKKNIIEVYEKEVGRFAMQEYEGNPVTLNALQTEAVEKIKQQFGWNKGIYPQSEVVLLHGVTSSGKTEMYVKLIETVLEKGKQVVYLLPEIALTSQIINRMRKYFGDIVGVYHSKFNENERVEIWNSVMATTQSSKNYKLIIGARSALFLPFNNLGLVIVDEEHDTSYKQYDPAPRYNARDAAIYLAHLHKAKTILGSATPSVESYYNAQEGKYGLVEIKKRFGGVQMPEILIADIKEATKKKMMKSHFSPLLLENISAALEKKEQVILFQNRRGFAPQLECNSCAWVPQCINCDVSLTYHKLNNQLRCHYCGYSVKPPSKCAACGDTELKLKGFGTEKIEEELSFIYPDKKIMRMDLDTTRNKYAHQHIIQDFEDRKIDILVGTQMVTKGLDFDNVSVVGILNADSMLNFPDFRSYERSFHLMAQVSGRAGRKEKRGKVIIQTYNPGHSIIREVAMNDYLLMYTEQLLDRRNFHYPPYYRLIELSIIHKDIDLVNAASKYLADKLRYHFKERVLGPEFPIIARIRECYHKNILIKIEKEASPTQVKKIISDLLTQLKADSLYKAIRVTVDVDPM